MGRKTNFTTRTLITFLIMVVIITAPFSYTAAWSPDMRLTTDDGTDWDPSITSTTDGEIWVVWRSDRMDNDEIYYKVFNGSSWSNDTRLTWEPHYDSYPSVMQASDGTIWVVWSSYRNEHDLDLYYKVFDGSWSVDTRLTWENHTDYYPSIMQASDGKIWVVWTSDRNEHDLDLYYKVFDGSWSDDTQLTTDLNTQDWGPSIMQASDGKIWIAFTKTTDTKHEDIYYKVFSGTEWSRDLRMTFDDKNSESHPSIMQASDGTIWVVWHSDRDVYENIYYRVRWINRTWSDPAKLTKYLADDMYPSITQTPDQTIWVAWGSWRSGFTDIYYKISYRDVAITEVTVPVDLVIRGETISINVTAINLGLETETFEVKCHANSTLVGSETISLDLNQTQSLTFQWNTTDFDSGKYNISATAVAVPREEKLYDNYLSDGLVEVCANVFDLSKAYGSEPGDPNWNLHCDFNKDNKIDASDLFDLSKNY